MRCIIATLVCIALPIIISVVVSYMYGGEDE
jgi:hypothetical protein